MSEVQTQATQPGNDIASSVQAEVQEALSKDPQRRMAEQVKKDLQEAGLEEPDKEAPAEAKKEEEESYQAIKDRVAKALKERKESYKYKESAKQEVESAKQAAFQAKQEAERTLQQVQAQQRQISQWVQALRANPAQALKMAGLDPEDFLTNLAKEGTPETKLQRQLREQQEKLHAFEKWQQEQLQAQQQALEEAQKQQAQAFRGKIETEFLAKANSDKFQNVKKALEYGLVSKKSLILEGDEIADTYREATGGANAELDEILEYIDSQLASAMSKLSPAQAAGLKDTGKPTQAQSAKLSPTLSNEDAGERRALDRTEIGADQEERKERAKAAVKAVLKKKT